MIHFEGLNILMSNGEHVPDWALYGSGALIYVALYAVVSFGFGWIRNR